jgi:hypothetical protein
LLYIILPIGAKGLLRHTVMCCTLSSVNTIGAKQCAALHKQFAVLHQFFPTLPIIWALVAEKRFLKNPTWCLFKIKKIISSTTTLKH